MISLRAMLAWAAGALPARRLAWPRSMGWAAAAAVALSALGLAAVLTAWLLEAGARDQALRAALALGSGHLTVQRDSYRPFLGPPITEAGEVYTSPALMRLAGKVYDRVQLSAQVAHAAPAGLPGLAIQLRGLALDSDPQALLLRPSVSAGAWPAPGSDREAPLILGSALAQRLKVQPGDSVLLRAEGGKRPRALFAVVAAIVETGLPPLDQNAAWCSLGVARALLPAPAGADRSEWVSQLAIYLERSDRADQWLADIRRLTLPEGVTVLHWRRLQPQALPEPWQRLRVVMWSFAVAVPALAALAGSVLLPLAGYGLLPFARPGSRAPRLPELRWSQAWLRALGLALAAAVLGLGLSVACTLVLGRIGLPLWAWLPADLNPVGRLLPPLVRPAWVPGRAVAPALLCVAWSTLLWAPTLRWAGRPKGRG